MRDAVAWCLRRARTWVALGAAVTATVLASGDDKVAWTAGVGLSTFGLALLSMRAHWLDEHPDRPDPVQSRHDAMVERALRRYHGAHEMPRMSRKERKAAEVMRQYDEKAAAYRAALKPPSRPE